MPVALDPNATIDVWLKTDEAKPPETRPTFVAHFLTCRETLQLEQLLEAAHKTKTNAEANAKLNEALALALVDWRNMVDRNGKAIPFPERTEDLGLRTEADSSLSPKSSVLSPSTFDDIGTVNEKWKLVYRILERTQLSEAEKGKSDSPQA